MSVHQPFLEAKILYEADEGDLNGEIYEFIPELAKKKYINSFANTKDELEQRLDMLIKDLKVNIANLREVDLMRFLVSWSANRGKGRSQTIAPQTAKKYIRMIRKIISERYRESADKIFPSLGRWEKGWIADIITNRKYEMKQANFFPVSLVKTYADFFDQDVAKWKNQNQTVKQFRSQLYYTVLVKTAMLISFATGNRMCEILFTRWESLSFHETAGMRGMLIKIGKSKSDLEGNRTGQISCFATNDAVCPVQAMSRWMKFLGIKVTKKGF